MNARTVYAKALTGWNRQGTIKGCFNLASVETKETEGTDAVSGGIAGENYGTIESCFNEGTVSSECEDGAHAGGITGYTYKSVVLELLPIARFPVKLSFKLSGLMKIMMIFTGN